LDSHLDSAWLLSPVLDPSGYPLLSKRALAK
jgi:hypothetical protein